jgi:hypothetical protein
MATSAIVGVSAVLQSVFQSIRQMTSWQHCHPRPSPIHHRQYLANIEIAMFDANPILCQLWHAILDLWDQGGI